MISFAKKRRVGVDQVDAGEVLGAEWTAFIVNISQTFGEPRFSALGHFVGTNVLTHLAFGISRNALKRFGEQISKFARHFWKDDPLQRGALLYLVGTANRFGFLLLGSNLAVNAGVFRKFDEFVKAYDLWNVSLHDGPRLADFGILMPDLSIQAIKPARQRNAVTPDNDAIQIPALFGIDGLA